MLKLHKLILELQVQILGLSVKIWLDSFIIQSIIGVQAILILLGSWMQVFLFLKIIFFNLHFQAAFM